MFYNILGGIGLIWSIFWFALIYESPAAHPRISAQERREIEEAIGTTTSKKKPSYVPWSDILTAPCVWAIIITHATSVFCYFTVTNELPTYMKSVLHFNIKEVCASICNSFRLLFLQLNLIALKLIFQSLTVLFLLS